MIKYVFQIIMACVVTTIFLIKVIPLMRKNVRCDVYDEFSQKSFNGLILEKYIDSTEHSYKTIILKQFENPSPEKYF